MGRAARRRYEEAYTLDRMVDAYSGLFRELAAPSIEPATG